MSKYEIKTVHHSDGSEDTFVIYSTEEAAFFAGYDFMGSVNWEKVPNHECELAKEDDPWQIVKDLEAADYDDQFPADKLYLFKATIDGEMIASVETAKRIAEIYQEDQYAGIYGDMKAYDIDGEPKRINLLDLVSPILAQWRWEEEEYRDYCENERYSDC